VAYPVTFNIEQPATFNRVQVALRLAIVIVLAILGNALGWIYGLIYLAIPVLAAVLISQKGSEKYLEESRTGMQRWLRFIIGFYSYLHLLTDRIPEDKPDDPVRYEIAPNGSPSVGQALLRIILAIPHVIVLFFLGIVAAILILIAAIMILVQESYPAGIYGFLRGYVRWQARLLAYMASLVDEYPPFAFDTGSESGGMPAAAPEPPPAATS